MRSPNTYTGQAEEYAREKNSIEKQIRLLAIFRLLSFAIPILSFVFLYKTNRELSWLIAGLGLVLFIAMVVLYERRQKVLELTRTLLRVYKEEIQALGGNDEAFGSGEQWLESPHDFAMDLDVFGTGSLYQHLNRCTGYAGERTLANWLSHPLKQCGPISERYEAIEELSSREKWRLRYRAVGLLQHQNESTVDRMMQWAEQPALYSTNPFFNAIRWIALIISVVLIVMLLTGLNLPGMDTGNVFIVWVLMQLGFAGSQLKKTNAAHEKLSRQSSELKHFADRLQLITDEEYSSPMLLDLKAALGDEKGGAAQAIRKLASLSAKFDNRLNMLGALILNGLFLWDLQCMLQLEKWRAENGHNIASWLDRISEMDALVSLAGFRYNHPEFSRPQCNDSDQFKCHAIELGHPLLEHSKRVCNDLELDGFGHFIVITGANMAGKSTFLRTVGVNLLLAQIGAPVCAKNLVFSPVSLFSSMRTTDSLQDGESYFFAELKRLSLLISRLKKGERMFVLLDEMLKGTNSRDKQQGSLALTANLVQLGAVGLLATHDLALGKLSEQFPGKVTNRCFEVYTNEDQMHFDYKLRAGICQNLNATFLMRKMGLMPLGEGNLIRDNADDNIRTQQPENGNSPAG